MTESGKDIVAHNCRKLAETYIRSNNFGRAFSHYLIALNLNPSWKTELKETLSVVLYKWGIILERERRFSDLFKCYEEAIEVFPENENILNNLGALLLKYGLLKEAASYFRRSLNIQPEFLQAVRNLENVSNAAVERWHFRMLNDIKRNKAYHDAIEKKLKQGHDVVLDIGTGTGILSLFASEAGAKEITACDLSPFMIDIAKEVIEENDCCHIQLLQKHSCDINIPTDMAKRVSLVVTEIMDCGLLGENILDTLIDAWDRLLVPSSNPPNQANGADGKMELGTVIPLGAVLYIAGIECDFISRKNFVMNNSNLNKVFSFNDYCMGYNKKYDSEYLKGVRGGFKYLTHANKSFFINFNDKNLMKKMLNGECDTNMVFKCEKSGRLDCLAVWFELYLDEDIILNTSPQSDSCESWDQAIFPLPNNICVIEGDEVTVNMSFKNGSLAFNKFTLNPINCLRTCIMAENKNTFQLSEELIRTLNSVTYYDSFLKINDLVDTKLKNNVSILDTFTFPFFGLHYLLRNRETNTSLTCVIYNEEDRNFFKFFISKYDLEKQVTLINEDEIYELDGQNQFDIILLNVVSKSGELKDNMIMHQEYFRCLLKCNMLLIPEKIKIVGQLIESEWLEKMSRVVNDDVTLGYKIGKVINSYQVNIHIDCNLSGISEVYRTEPFELCIATMGRFKKQLRVPVINSGKANALIYWFNISLLNGCAEISTFEDGMTNQAVLLFPKQLISSFVTLTIIYDNGLFKLDNLSCEDTKEK